MKRLLMATDLSARSDRAFERALLLANEHQAELHVIYIVDGSLPEAIATNQKMAAEESIGEQIASASVEPAFPIKAEVKVDKNSTGIVRYANEIQAELIVLGLRNTAYESPFRGTTSEQIVRMSGLPVLVVADRAKDAYRRIAIAVDFSVHSRRAIEVSMNLVPNAEVHLIHSYQVPFAGFMYGTDSHDKVEKAEQRRLEQMVEEEMATSLSKLAIDKDRLNLVIKEGEVRHVIAQEVRRIKPDLLALGTHGRTGIANAFLGSVADAVIGDPPCDTLAVKAW